MAQFTHALIIVDAMHCLLARRDVQWTNPKKPPSSRRPNDRGQARGVDTLSDVAEAMPLDKRKKPKRWSVWLARTTLPLR